MIENNGWKKVCKDGKVGGGRPSKIAFVLGMDLGGFYEMGKVGGGSLNGSAEALMKWVGAAGVVIGKSTAKRVIHRLISLGKVEKVNVGRGNGEFLIKPLGL